MLIGVLCTYIVGDVPGLPGCEGGEDAVIILDAGETAPVGCNVCILPGSRANLDCTASVGDQPISYLWTGPQPDGGTSTLSSNPILPVSREGEYECTASNAELPEGVQSTTNVFCEFPMKIKSCNNNYFCFLSIQSILWLTLVERYLTHLGIVLAQEIVDVIGIMFLCFGEGNVYILLCTFCRLRSSVNPQPDFCVLLGERLTLRCVDVDNNPLNITISGMLLMENSMVLDDSTVTNFTFNCRQDTNTPCGDVASVLNVNVFGECNHASHCPSPLALSPFGYGPYA